MLGLVALPIRIGQVEAIVLTAPGVYFGSDDGRSRLSALSEASKTLPATRSTRTIGSDLSRSAA